MGVWDGVASAGMGLGMGMMNMFGQRAREDRSNRNTVKMMGIQHGNQMDLNRQGQELQMKTWRDTNYGPQMEMMKGAGLNPALMYGGAGSGGQTGSQGGGSAASGNAAAPQPMELGNIMQAALLKAQKENIEEDTKGKEASRKGTTEDTIGTKFQNDINEKYKFQIEQGTSWEWDMKRIEGEEKNAVWEMRNAIWFVGEDGTKGPVNRDDSRLAKAIIGELKAAEETGDIAGFEKAIKKFEKELTDKGLSPNTPWYAKLIAELLAKVGIIDGEGDIKILKN